MKITEPAGLAKVRSCQIARDRAAVTVTVLRLGRHARKK